jgi:hypothetical protein
MLSARSTVGLSGTRRRQRHYSSSSSMERDFVSSLCHHLHRPKNFVVLFCLQPRGCSEHAQRSEAYRRHLRTRLLQGSPLPRSPSNRLRQPCWVVSANCRFGPRSSHRPGRLSVLGHGAHTAPWAIMPPPRSGPGHAGPPFPHSALPPLHLGHAVARSKRST